jgi:hypothetical protein
VYRADVPTALGPFSLNHARSGPSGDIARPPYLGDAMPAMSPAIKQYKRYAKRVRSKERQVQDSQIAFYRARMAAQLQAQARANCAPAVIRLGTHSTNEMISGGVPEPLSAVIGPMPDPIATARSNGLALQNALALQNSLALENALALENEGFLESATMGEKVMLGLVVLGGIVAADRTWKLGLTRSIRPY